MNYVGSKALARLAALALITLLAGCGSEPEFTSYLENGTTAQTLEVNGTTVTVEIATDGSQRSVGLQQRSSMPPDHGMLFIYPKAAHQRMGMKDVHMDLDVAFLSFKIESLEAKVVNITSLQRLEELPGAVSIEPVTMVLQMRKGWFAEHGLQAGSTFTMPEWVLDLSAE